MKIYLVPFCIMAESRSQLAPLGRRPHATNHPQHKWFAIQKLLQAEGTGSAQALMQERFGVTCAWGTAVRSWCRHSEETREEFEMTHFYFVYVSYYCCNNLPQTCFNLFFKSSFPCLLSGCFIHYESWVLKSPTIRAELFLPSVLWVFASYSLMVCYYLVNVYNCLAIFIFWRTPSRVFGLQ